MSAPQALGNPFIDLTEVESTNNYAMGLVHEGMAQHGAAVFTSNQTQGKGQRTKKWVSEPGMNIALSIILEPKGLAVSQFFLLSMAVSVAVRNLFEKYAGTEVKIKWPNDIYWRDRKAAGILIENIVQTSKWKYAIVGIGLNVNQVHFDGLEKLAVSLKQITGKDFNPAQLAKEMCNEVNISWENLLDDAGRVVTEYHTHLYKLNEVIRLKKDSRVFDATLKTVNTSGQLVVQHALEEKFDVGEVEWLVQGKE